VPQVSLNLPSPNWWFGSLVYRDFVDTPGWVGWIFTLLVSKK